MLVRRGALGVFEVELEDHGVRAPTGYQLGLLDDAVLLTTITDEAAFLLTSPSRWLDSTGCSRSVRSSRRWSLHISSQKP